MRIADVLRSKGTAVATVTPTVTVGELLAQLAEHNVGALVVVAEDGTVAGIVSERDIVRRLTEQRDVTLALFELRLESARRPEVAALMGDWLRVNNDPTTKR